MFFVVQYNYKERINFLEKRKNVKSKTITEKHVQDMERIKNLRLIDDNFMTRYKEITMEPFQNVHDIIAAC